MGARGWAAVVAFACVVAPVLAGCASSESEGAPAGDASVDGAGDRGAGDAAGGPSPDAIAPASDGALGGKSCAGLADGTPCGPAPDVCHDIPTCAQGACGAAAAKADGTACGAAPDACRDAPTCSGGKCGAPPAKPDGTNWSAGDATAICCAGKEVHASTDTDCGTCGIACNASNGESCQILGGHYFCRGCIASDACWSHCCSESFTPYSCAASDCAGNCSSMYCPAGTHCVSGGTTSSDYCSY
jgi:hypothetical protein